MQLDITGKALKQLGKIPSSAQLRMRERLNEIAANPFADLRNVERLLGGKNWFRLRIGDWRALYRVDVSRQTVIVEHIAKRGEVYR